MKERVSTLVELESEYWKGKVMDIMLDSNMDMDIFIEKSNTINRMWKELKEKVNTTYISKAIYAEIHSLSISCQNIISGV